MKDFNQDLVLKNKLKEYRTLNKMSQSELAKRVGV